VLATGLIGLSAAPAAADSIAAQIARAERQLNALDAAAEKAAEQYNEARIKLTAAERSAMTAQARLGRAQTQLARLQSTVSAFASAAYRGQGMDSFMSVADSGPATFLDKMSTLQAVSRNQQEALAALAVAQHQREQAKSDADNALATQKSVTARVEADRAAVQQAAARQQQILRGLQATQARLIREARARAARLAAERLAAELAARARAAAAAAAAMAAQPTSYVSQPVVTGSGGAKVAVEWAYRELGKPYVWGAAGPDSFDCSGLTQYVWAKAGVYLDHYTGAQWNEGRHVSRSELQPGDLVFFGSDLHHVGIYVGNGNMIEAPHSGTDVRVAPYDRPDYAGAVRPGG
jgi:cell wall-associated NlpC family hydrolase